jgi:hypothetical protein
LVDRLHKYYELQDEVAKYVDDIETGLKVISQLYPLAQMVETQDLEVVIEDIKRGCREVAERLANTLRTRNA